ncbi:hypothetical protein [Kaistella antarctica]|uniref:DUF4595 domain-containing protein n=1 Tax=Kaistella antarctica TaxID=266748 RepID=A0A3S4YTN9_9FLAO|nr:hypothetical protein [Kaistella antarctica]KEY17799.1 hypothetical protein HY04_04470 [Kaistella antarctica]SEV80051.1 hypothetical protein SAMN05421765_0083 [Kaistella antarctica]VEI00011.1 Uncharacterised protein [Kaistella antarctica]
MKKIFGILSLIFSMVILFSCEPSREDGDLLLGIKDPEQPRLLKKIVSNWKDQGTNEQKVSEITYTYNENKLISYEDIFAEPTLVMYNSDNKISELSNTNQTVTFQYEAENVSKITIVIPNISTTTTSYTYSASQVVKAKKDQQYFLPIPKKTYSETSYEYTGPNMTKATLKTGTYLANGNVEMNPEDQILTFTYARKRSPYTLLPKEFVVYLAGIDRFGPALLSAGTFTKVSTEPGTIEDVNFIYVYDNADYPTQRNKTDDETKFEYK